MGRCSAPESVHAFPAVGVASTATRASQVEARAAAEAVGFETSNMELRYVPKGDPYWKPDTCGWTHFTFSGKPIISPEGATVTELTDLALRSPFGAALTIGHELAHIRFETPDEGCPAGSDFTDRGVRTLAKEKKMTAGEWYQLALRDDLASAKEEAVSMLKNEFGIAIADVAEEDIVVHAMQNADRKSDSYRVLVRQRVLTASSQLDHPRAAQPEAPGRDD